MDWQALLSPDIKSFIREHENDDVRKLALKKCPNLDWPYPLILDQIKARQKAKIKIPSWLEHEDIIFPSNDTLEQASSEACAKYKASLFKGRSFVDLTGGAGVDSWAILENFDNCIIIDANTNASARIAHNLMILNKKSSTIQNTSSEKFIKNMQPIDLALIDPQRRNSKRKGLYKLEDCSPNIIQLLPNIKAKTILLKTSPMLDINQGIDQLNYVSAVHVVEWKGECKELLFILKPNVKTNQIPITAVKLNDQGHAIHSFTFTREDEQNTKTTLSKPLKYLYEPSPALMKSGGYKSIADTYTLSKLHTHTHLYTSDTLIDGFPGRSFELIETYAAKTKKFPFKKANLTIRNFPQETEALKKKLKLKDGGDEYLFACTITENNSNKNSHMILHCRKKT